MIKCDKEIGEISHIHNHFFDFIQAFLNRSGITQKSEANYILNSNKMVNDGKKNIFTE